MLGALARALRLTADERDHLFHLTGEEPPRETAGSTYVRPGLLLILDRLHDTPAQVLSDIGDVLAQNAMSAALHGDMSARPPAMRNIIRRLFLDPAEARDHPAGRTSRRLARSHVAHCARCWRPGREDPRPAALVAELRASSPLFAQLWEDHEVAVRRSDMKRFLHPVVGELSLECEVLLSAAHDQRLVVFTARPGSESYERFNCSASSGSRTFRSVDTTKSTDVTVPTALPRTGRWRRAYAMAYSRGTDCRRLFSNSA